MKAIRIVIFIPFILTGCGKSVSNSKSLVPGSDSRNSTTDEEAPVTNRIDHEFGNSKHDHLTVSSNLPVEVDSKKNEGEPHDLAGTRVVSASRDKNIMKHVPQIRVDEVEDRNLTTVRHNSDDIILLDE